MSNDRTIPLDKNPGPEREEIPNPRRARLESQLAQRRHLALHPEDYNSAIDGNYRPIPGMAMK